MELSKKVSTVCDIQKIQPAVKIGLKVGRKSDITNGGNIISEININKEITSKKRSQIASFNTMPERKNEWLTSMKKWLEK